MLLERMELGHVNSAAFSYNKSRDLLVKKISLRIKVSRNKYMTRRIIISLTGLVLVSGLLAEVPKYSNEFLSIGVGSRGNAPIQVQDMFGRTVLRDMPVEIDEEVLQRIAETTGGTYFRATDNNKLREIYQEIDQLEKTRLDVKHFSKKKEEYFPFLLAAMLILLFEILLRYTLFRTIP